MGSEEEGGEKKVLPSSEPEGKMGKGGECDISVMNEAGGYW